MGNAQWGLQELVAFLRENWPRNTVDKKRSTTPIMLVCHNPHKVFERLHRVYKNDPQWNFRFTVRQPERFHLDGKVRKPRIQQTSDLGIGYFGFQLPNRHTQYFHPVSPYDFMDDFGKYGDTSLPEYIRLYEWGGNLRKWIRRNKLRFSTRKGGLAAQLLRDKRFYPKPRRKVPKLTNEKARTAMPGNYYAMTTDRVGKLYSKVYVIDQENAHHYAAETVQLPDANTLFAHGRYRTQWDKPCANYDKLIQQYGLFRVRIWVPKYLGGVLPPFASKSGLHNVYLYSNELSLCRELGIEIRHIAYCWTSPHLDTGLARYAQWAQREVTEHPHERPWLKPTLLSAYGILGVRPRQLESAYYRTDKGEPKRYLLGPMPIMMKQIKTKREVQGNVANTVHRGLIEAETRRLSIVLARQFETEGNTVIAVHADAVLVKDEGQTLPLLPKPWRVKDRLTGFTAIDHVSFESDSMVIMPGRKRAAR